MTRPQDGSDRRAKGEGYVSKTAINGLHRGSLTHDGKTRWVYDPKPAGVRKKLRELQRRWEEGRWDTEEITTVSDLLDAWMKTKEGRVSYNTLRTYKPMVKHLKDHLGTRKLEKLKPSHVQDAYLAMADAGVPSATVRYCANVLRMALKMAVEWRVITWSPAQVIPMPTHTKRKIEVLESAELLQLFADTRGDDLHALYVVGGTSAMRLSEMLGLQWSKIDWEHGRYELAEQLEYRDHDGFHIVPLKGRDEDESRTIMFSVRALQALREHQALQSEWREAAGESWHQSDLVFTRRDGQPLHKQAVARRFKEALLKQSIVRFSPHALRHTVISLWLLNGVTLTEVAEWAGHADGAITLRIYAHLDKRAKFGMGRRIDMILDAAEAEILTQTGAIDGTTPGEVPEVASIRG